jgi:MerR family transcriptional regulator, light-induced transcriptional regulator
LLFARRAVWLRRAEEARGLDVNSLRVALHSLGEALREELPTHLGAVATAPVDMAIAKVEAPLEPDEQAADAATPAGRLTLRYLAMCLAAETERAMELVLNAVGELTPEQIYVDVLVPAQREIGRLWHVGDATVTEERLVSETTRQLMAILVHLHAPRPAGDKTALAAAVPGNAHDIGLGIVADLYRLAGRRCIYLGANLPSEQLAQGLRMFEIDLVILTATLTTQLQDASKAIETVRQTSPKARVLVGGQAFEGSPDLWRRIGADGYAASVGDAVAAGEALMRKGSRAS